jgi:hypothetical protein
VVATLMATFVDIGYPKFEIYQIQYTPFSKIPRTSNQQKAEYSYGVCISWIYDETIGLSFCRCRTPSN